MIFTEIKQALVSLRTKREALYKYCQLISKRISEPVSTKMPGVSELHHIIPKCVVKWSKIRDSKHNLIRLYHNEHFLAHYYLTKIFPNNVGLHQAFVLMSAPHYKKTYTSIEQMADDYHTSKEIVYKNRKNKSYSNLYGSVKAEQIKIQQKKARLDRQIRFLVVDK